jgi:hypothetical protein
MTRVQPGGNPNFDPRSALLAAFLSRPRCNQATVWLITGNIPKNLTEIGLRRFLTENVVFDEDKTPHAHSGRL